MRTLLDRLADDGDLPVALNDDGDGLSGLALLLDALPAMIAATNLCFEPDLTVAGGRHVAG
jgi:hypothetical protein